LKSAGKTILLSTHMMDEAERLCDTVTLIHKGKVVLAGETGKVQGEFGARKIQLEFAGDGAALKALPGVAAAQVDATRATLTLADGGDPRAVLRAALERVEIRRFDSGLASLEEIFIRTVGEELNAQEGN
jgi:ABC-2 type transport system ATP-binding protein